MMSSHGVMSPSQTKLSASLANVSNVLCSCIGHTVYNESVKTPDYTVKAAIVRCRISLLGSILKR